MENEIEIPEREEITSTIALYTCTKNCMGISGNQAGCCTIASRDYIIGPIPDADDLLERLNSREGQNHEWKDVFIDADEGRELFPEKPSWQKDNVYPALRVDTSDKRLPCIFLGKNGLCSIHDIRSVTCSNYNCGFLKELNEKF